MNLWPEDGKVRRAYLSTTIADLEDRVPSPWEPKHYSLAGRTVQALGREDLLGEDGSAKSFRLTDMSAVTSGHLPYAPRSLFKIFDDGYWAANFDSGKVFKDKVVFIAPAAPSFQDIHTTAEGEIYGIHFHMNVVAATLAGEFYTRSSWAVGVAAILLMGLAAMLVIGFVKRPVLKLALLMGISAGYLVLALLVYNGLDVLLPVAPPVLAGLSGGIFAFGYDFAVERRRELRLRRTLERYTSRELVSEILANRDDYLESLGGAQRGGGGSVSCRRAPRVPNSKFQIPRR